MAKQVDCSELAHALSDYSKAVADRAGIKNYDDVVGHITKDFPEVTRRDISEAILAKHRFENADKPEKRTKLFTKIKQQEAMPEGRAKELIDKLEALHKEGAFESNMPKQRKAVNQTLEALRAERDKLRRESELKKEVAGLQQGELPKRTPAPERFMNDPKMRALKNQRDKLIQELGAPAKIESRIKQLTDQIEAIQGGKLPETKTPAAKNPRVAALEKQRDTLLNNSRRIASLDEQISAYEAGKAPGKMHGPQKPPLPEVSAREEKLGDLKRKADLSDNIDFLVRALETDHLPQPKVRTEPSDDILRLQIKRDKLIQEVRQRREDLKPRGFFRKRVLDPVNTAQGLVRSVWTSLDLSAPGRQGKLIGAGHPIRWAKSMVPMIKAYGSETAARRVQDSIENRDNSLLYHKSGLEFSDWGGRLGEREELFSNRIAGKLPGVKASERAYSTFLNKLRADSFDAMTNALGRNATKEEAKAIANYINVVTGRGSVGKHGQAFQDASAILFSPRLFWSRIQYLGGQPFYDAPPAVRKLIAKEYARTALGFATMGALAIGAGATIEKDPRSSDFVKFKFGNTRIDTFAGLQQPAVFAARAWTGQTKKPSGEIQPLRERATGPLGPLQYAWGGGKQSKVPYGKSDMMDVAKNFARSKAAPGVGIMADIASGKGYTGEPVDWKYAAKVPIPLGWRSVVDAMEEEGIPKGAAFGILGLMGEGVQSYKPQEKKSTGSFQNP